LGELLGPNFHSRPVSRWVEVEIILPV